VALVHTEAKLKELGITLPDVIAAKGNYMSFVRTGNHLFLAGEGEEVCTHCFAHSISYSLAVLSPQYFTRALFCLL
jgi:hypothetical protein